MTHVKLRFPFTNSRDEDETETMWTLPRSEGYEIDNIPFYAKELALGDIVAAEPDADGVLWYSRLIRAGGHSTIRLWFASASDVQEVRNELRELGCPSEVSDLARLIAVDVPPNVPYAPIRAYLESREDEGMFEYEEGCLAQPSERD